MYQLLAAALGVIAKPHGASVNRSTLSSQRDEDWAMADAYYTQHDEDLAY